MGSSSSSSSSSSSPTPSRRQLSSRTEHRQPLRMTSPRSRSAQASSTDLLIDEPLNNSPEGSMRMTRTSSCLEDAENTSSSPSRRRQRVVLGEISLVQADLQAQEKRREWTEAATLALAEYDETSPRMEEGQAAPAAAPRRSMCTTPQRRRMEEQDSSSDSSLTSISSSHKNQSWSIFEDSMGSDEGADTTGQTSVDSIDCGKDDDENLVASILPPDPTASQTCPLLNSRKATLSDDTSSCPVSRPITRQRQAIKSMTTSLPSPVRPILSNSKPKMRRPI